ncbi:MAG: hypothetical protein U0792_21780 [Gemmataceae bacterium]
MNRVLLCVLAVWALTSSPGFAADPKDLAEAAVKAAGGVDKLPKIIHWKETYFFGEKPGDKGTQREAFVAPPLAWYQNGRDIAAGNPDRTEKAYLVWVWTLAPLLDKDTTLKLLPDSTLNDKPIKGLRISREKQKDIDVYFHADTKQLARIDWRNYQIDFADWKEAEGFKFPAKAFVRRKDGKLHLRTEFQVLEVLKELPKELKK